MEGSAAVPRVTAVLPEVYGWVVQQSGRYAGQVYPLGQRTILGSDRACDIVVSGAAPRHAELVLQADLSWTVSALDDAELILDGEQVRGASWPVHDGARLGFGSTQVIFKCVGRE
jgi:hypothetical protein